MDHEFKSPIFEKKTANFYHDQDSSSPLDPSRNVLRTKP